MRIRNLIILGGHGVNIDPRRPLESRSWVGTYSYDEEAQLLTEHCRTAVALAASSPQDALVFSGGITRAEAPALSEAESYLRIARTAGWWGHPSVEGRTLTEENARDSLGNLLLSIAVFKRKFGLYPKSITVVGFRFKEDRFRRHAKALNWTGGFSYVGANNPPQRCGVLARALAGEKAKREALATDPLLRAERWQNQRRKRNPLGQVVPRFDEDPELTAFLDFVLDNGPECKPPWT